jgi:hypothetical protein
MEAGCRRRVPPQPGLDFQKASKTTRPNPRGSTSEGSHLLKDHISCALEAIDFHAPSPDEIRENLESGSPTASALFWSRITYPPDRPLPSPRSLPTGFPEPCPLPGEEREGSKREIGTSNGRCKSTPAPATNFQGKSLFFVDTGSFAGDRLREKESDAPEVQIRGLKCRHHQNCRAIFLGVRTKESPNFRVRPEAVNVSSPQSSRGWFSLCQLPAPESARTVLAVGPANGI